MTLEKIELDKKMLEYSISQFRVIPEYEKICEAFTVGLSSIQDVVDYLSNMIDIDEAEGIWLDYIGWLVGEFRGEYIDTAKYFCANQTGTDEFGNPIGDINKSKFFYFSSLIAGNNSDLSDDLYRAQIKAKILYNNSNGTREDLIKIIKLLLNADKVIIEQKAPMLLKVSVYGENVLTVDMVNRVSSVLPEGVGLYENDITVYSNMTYEDIERRVNEIVEMSNISEPDPNYEYDDIDSDLDDILEI